MGWVRINWTEYKHSKRASIASWIAGRFMFVWLVPWFVIAWLLSEYTRIDDLICCLIALVLAAFITGFTMIGLNKLAEKWAKQDTIEYYRQHPEEYAALVRRIEAEKNSDLRKFY